MTTPDKDGQNQVHFYQSLGFTTNPFAVNAAEREPHIELYVVRPPYLDPVEAASFHTGSYTLSGIRGSGKSATRITVQRNIWARPEPHPLPVALTNFTSFRGKKKAAELLNLFAEQVFFLTIEACFVYFTTISPEELNRRFESFDKPTKNFVNRALNNYYLNRSEAARSASAQECFELFAVSMSRRSHLWAEKKWEALSAGLIEIASGIAKKYGIDIGDGSSLKKAFSKDEKEGDSDPLYVLQKSVEFARLMGFSCLLVQVDKVDEADWTQNNAEEAAKLIWPLYTNVHLHEIEGLSWSFFLWNQIRTLLVEENGMPVRWDKLPNDRIKWDNNHLERLVEKRLGHFSHDKITSISGLFGDGSTDQQIYTAVLSISGLAPRTLITVLNSVLINHIQEVEGKPKLMTMDSFERGLDTYARTTIRNDYDPNTIAQLQRVGTTKFVTKDVTKVFAIISTAARKKIENWVKNGLVRRSIPVPVMTGEGTKPVDQFVVSEPRAIRIIERSLDVEEG